MIAPTLTTDRLTLRALSDTDIAPLTAFYGSEEHSRFVGGPMDPVMAWRALAKEIGHWTLKGFGRWSVRRTACDTPVGIVGLWEPFGWPEPEIGWYIYTDHIGHGYAPEAARAARDYAYQTLGWTTAISLIDDANSASQSVATKLGASPEGPFDLPIFGKTMIWRHPSVEKVGG